MDASEFIPCDTEGFEDYKVLRVTQKGLISAIARVTGASSAPYRLLLTAEGVPQDTHSGHDPRWALVLEEEAALWLRNSSKFVTYGTSWKSTDFMPKSRERPIHRIIFETALIFECLDLAQFLRALTSGLVRR
jgi:hypothetical protein